MNVSIKTEVLRQIDSINLIRGKETHYENCPAA
jgi:hypothetical protein